MNTIKNNSCIESIQIFTFSLVLRTRDNTDVFIYTLDEHIYGMHSKK